MYVSSTRYEIVTLYVERIRGGKNVTRGDVSTKMAPMLAKPAVVLVMMVVVMVVVVVVGGGGGGW